MHFYLGFIRWAKDCGTKTTRNYLCLAFRYGRRGHVTILEICISWVFFPPARLANLQVCRNPNCEGASPNGLNPVNPVVSSKHYVCILLRSFWGPLFGGYEIPEMQILMAAAKSHWTQWLMIGIQRMDESMSHEQKTLNFRILVV